MPAYLRLHHGWNQKNLQDYLHDLLGQHFGLCTLCHLYQDQLCKVGYSFWCNVVCLYGLYIFRDPFFDVEIKSSAFCGMLETNSPLLELSSLIFFLLPFFIMVYLYICMSIKIRKSTKIILGCDRNELDKRHKNRRAILKMLGKKSKVMPCYI